MSDGAASYRPPTRGGYTNAGRGPQRPLVGLEGALAWWFDGELLRISHRDRPTVHRGKR
jgi:hypothetical protein